MDTGEERKEKIEEWKRQMVGLEEKIILTWLNICINKKSILITFTMY